MEWKWSVLWEYREFFIQGVINSALLTIVGITFGTILGLILGLLKISRKKIFTIPATLYIDVFRGTPLMLQILFIHFVIIPTLVIDVLGFSQAPGALFSGFVALSLNAGAYIAEIFRGGIQSIEKGQMEAARSLGMSYGMAMREVILPQAFKRMLPPLGNEFIALLKDSSLLAIIAVNDITYGAFSVAKSTFVRFPPYILGAVLYLFLTYLLSRLVFYLEKRVRTSTEHS
ncbi:amino acid ABC transporter permease [Mechercharimyces sp. CAU 1602]|nr:amino acid ABC transporter permease [Mechercharimyces sp. CAU 1602]MCS1352233.1 amino acid ABC transporter permease [Mechercharimyces sp. CAU 1602]